MADVSEPTNGVRVTNAEIYRVVLDTQKQVWSLDQALTREVLPAIERHDEELDKKADAHVVDKIGSRTERIEMRVYAMLSGLIAALLGAKWTGLL